MTLTTHGHPSWEPMVEQSLYRLGTYWTAIPSGRLAEYVRMLKECSAEGIDAAITILADQKEPLRDRPKPGQIKAAIPYRLVPRTDPRASAWWHTDGSFGGNWDNVSQRELEGILTTMHEVVRKQPTVMRAERGRFIKFLEGRGVQHMECKAGGGAR